jgi:hypothetical protein
MLLKVMSEINATLYPERLGRLYVVNAPIFFSAAWTMIKVWLDPRVIDKIHILGSDYKKILLESIDHDQLPTFVGGSCTCSHMAGGCVPSPKEDIPAKLDGYRYSTVLKKDHDPHHHRVKLERPGKIHYKFKSSTDCKIEIHHSPGNAMIHTHEHCESSAVVEVGPGTYITKWEPICGKKVHLEYSVDTSHDVTSPADSGKDLCGDEYY